MEKEKNYRVNFDNIYFPADIDAIINKDTDMKVVDKIRIANQKYLEDTAILFFGNKIKYSEIFRKIDSFAVSLQKLGLKKEITLPFVFQICRKQFTIFMLAM